MSTISVRDANNATQTVVTSSRGAGHVPHYIEDSEFRLLAKRGKLSGYSVGYVHGYSTLISGTTAIDLWSMPFNKTYPAAAATVEVRSTSANDTSAGTGARTLTLTGLDSNYSILSETITLLGSTRVSSTNSFRRILDVRVASAGSTGSNEGEITVEQASVLLATISIGLNRSFMTHYTVPSGKKLYVSDLSVQTLAGASAQAFLMVRPNNGVWSESIRLVSNGDHSRRSFDLWEIEIDEKSDIVIRGARQSGTGAITVIGTFSYLLVDTSADT